MTEMNNDLTPQKKKSQYDKYLQNFTSTSFDRFFSCSSERQNVKNELVFNKSRERFLYSRNSKS
jgi:hypothetical protein